MLGNCKKLLKKTFKPALLTILLGTSWLNEGFSETKATPPAKWQQELLTFLGDNSFKNIKTYPHGVYGKYDDRTIFISRVEVLPTWTRLYWAMVNVLSDKYGCFMTQKWQVGNATAFRCRDSRTVVFNKFRKGDIVYFYGRQYDESGQPMYVDEHKIVNRE